MSNTVGRPKLNGAQAHSMVDDLAKLHGISRQEAKSHLFAQLYGSTGRIGTSAPNLQNLPANVVSQFNQINQTIGFKSVKKRYAVGITLEYIEEFQQLPYGTEFLYSGAKVYTLLLVREGSNGMVHVDLRRPDGTVCDLHLPKGAEIASAKWKIHKIPEDINYLDKVREINNET